MTTLPEFQDILKELDDALENLEVLNSKIILDIGKKYAISNSQKHLERGRKRIYGSMVNKYGHLV